MAESIPWPWVLERPAQNRHLLALWLAEVSVDRNSKHSRKPNRQDDERPVFDKDQPSEPAGGPNPGRYKKELPATCVNDERHGRPKEVCSQEIEPRDTPDVERPPDEDVTDTADERQAPPFTGEDVEHPRKRPEDRQQPRNRERRIH